MLQIIVVIFGVFGVYFVVSRVVDWLDRTFLTSEIETEVIRDIAEIDIEDCSDKGEVVYLRFQFTDGKSHNIAFPAHSQHALAELFSALVDCTTDLGGVDLEEK